jgi:hypothetical protein
MDPLQGEVVAEHAATLTNRVFAVLLLVLPGLVLAFAATQLGSTEADMRAPFAVAGVVLVALGALVLAQQGKSRVLVHSDGVERWGLRGKLWELTWMDAVELRYRVIKIRLGGLLGILLPALGTNIHIALVDSTGKVYKLPANLKGMDVLAERVVDQQTTAHFPAARTKIDAGEEVRFGKSVALDKEKISARKLFGGFKTCPLGEIEKVSVVGGFLKIRQKGKTFAFTTTAAAQIPNVFILLRLLESLTGKKDTLHERDFSSQAYVG